MSRRKIFLRLFSFMYRNKITIHALDFSLVPKLKQAEALKSFAYINSRAAIWKLLSTVCLCNVCFKLLWLQVYFWQQGPIYLLSRATNNGRTGRSRGGLTYCYTGNSAHLIYPKGRWRTECTVDILCIINTFPSFYSEGTILIRHNNSTLKSTV